MSIDTLQSDIPHLKDKFLRLMIGAVAWRRGYEDDCPSPHFCQDGSRDFFKIDEIIGVGMG